MPSTRFANGHRPGNVRLFKCPACGEQMSTRNGITTHTVDGRGDRWGGTLAELAVCNPAPAEMEGSAS